MQDGVFFLHTWLAMGHGCLHNALVDAVHRFLNHNSFVFVWSLADSLAQSVAVSQPTPINIQKPSERNKMLYSFDIQTDGFTDKRTLRASG